MLVFVMLSDTKKEINLLYFWVTVNLFGTFSITMLVFPEIRLITYFCETIELHESMFLWGPHKSLQYSVK